MAGLLPALLDDARPDPARPQLRLLVANVWFPGDHYDRLAALVERERPDVVALTELTHAWAAGLEGPLREYRHRLLEPQLSAYGLGLYSRRPLEGARVVRLGGRPPIVARAALELGRTRLELFLVHAPGVIGGGPAARQREFMPQLAALARSAGPTALVCGDLNAAPWSGPLRELLGEGRLQRDDPWRPGEWTFPVWNRVLGTPIDQCLAGRAVAVATRTGPDIGSDHLPLLVEVG